MPRRRRRVINWGPVLVLAIVVNVAVAAFHSPLTSLRLIRVEGAPAHERSRLQKILEQAEHMAYANVPVEQLESQVLHNPAVYGAELRHNLFGRGLLTVTYREPVARVSGMPGIVIDRKGVLFKHVGDTANLRPIKLEPGMLAPNLSFSHTWPASRIASFVTELDNIDALEGMTLYLDSRGRLWLNGGGASRIDFGGTDALDEKLEQLRSLLGQRPNLLKEVKSLSLTDPKRPAIVPLANR